MPSRRDGYPCEIIARPRRSGYFQHSSASTTARARNADAAVRGTSSASAGPRSTFFCPVCSADSCFPSPAEGEGAGTAGEGLEFQENLYRLTPSPRTGVKPWSGRAISSCGERGKKARRELPPHKNPCCVTTKSTRRREAGKHSSAG